MEIRLLEVVRPKMLLLTQRVLGEANGPLWYFGAILSTLRVLS